MDKSLFVLLLSLFLISTASPAATPAAEQLAGADGALDRQLLIASVLERNPSLESARQALRAAAERELQAGALDDPMLMSSLAPLSIGGERLGVRLEGRQRLPFPGKRRLRTDIARAETSARHSELESVRLELALTASALYDQYYFVERSLEITREHMALLRDLKDSAEAQYVVGRAAQQDPLQAEVELTHLMHQEIVLRTDRRELTARLNQLLHRSPSAELPPPPESLDASAASIPESEALQALALERRPELAAAAARLDSERARVALAELDFYPDFEVMSSYNSMWMTSEHQFMAGVGVNLPVWREKRRAAVREAEADAARQESEIERLVDELSSEVERAHLDVAETRHVIELYSNRLLPAARDQVAAAHTGFVSNRNSFVAVIEAEKNLRAVELRFQEAVATLFTALARLEYAVGLEPFELTRRDTR